MRRCFARAVSSGPLPAFRGEKRPDDDRGVCRCHRQNGRKTIGIIVCTTTTAVEKTQLNAVVFDSRDRRFEVLEETSRLG